MQTSIRLLRLLVFAGALLVSAIASSQTWPAKPVHIVVGYPAGGVADVMTRVIAIRIAGTLGQPVVVENRPGADANIAIEMVSKAGADGYTMLTTGGYVITSPMLYPGLRWRLADLAPVARFSVGANLLVVPASLPVKSLKDFVRYAKENPGLAFGDTGPNALQSQGLMMLEAVAGINALKVSYKGSPVLLPDLVDGRIKAAVLPANVALPLLRGGRLIALANTGDTRSPLFPNVPTLAEEGYGAATLMSWQGIHVPAGTPSDVIQKVSDAIGEATKNEDVKTKIEKAGGEIAFLDTQAFKAFLQEEETRWKAFIQTIGKK